MAKSLTLRGLGSSPTCPHRFIRSQVDVDLKDITENISDIFSDLEIEQEDAEGNEGEENIDQ